MRLMTAARSLARPVRAAWRRSGSQKAIRNLNESGPIGQTLSSILVRETADEKEPTIERIEAERQALLEDRRMLVDGTLGPPGLYDEGRAVADVTQASRKPRDARRLYDLVIGFKPRTILELGTNVGVSSAYLAAAQLVIGGGEVVTLDASPYRQAIARRLHSACGLHSINYVSGLFTDTLATVLETIPAPDLVFIDGHHQYEPTLRYFDEIVVRSSPASVFVFDDINWSEGMQKAWRQLEADNRFRITLDLGSMGVGVVSADDQQQRISVKIGPLG